MTACRNSNIKNVLVTNGCFNKNPSEKILSLTDACNVDLKTINPKTYKDFFGGDLSSVLDFIVLSVRNKVHIEVTTLIIPGINDSCSELDAI
jgi:pyruvate formate lyase activating enzyme